MSDLPSIVRQRVSEAVNVLDLAAPTHHRSMSEFVVYEQPRSGLEVKTWTWPTLRFDNCVELDGANVELRSDGIATFRSVLFTYEAHSGDRWWSSFAVQDKDGVSLYVENFRKGPRMEDGNGGPPPRYRWEFSFNFPINAFGPASRILYGYKC